MDLVFPAESDLAQVKKNDDVRIAETMSLGWP
jgi:hypothetical protein